MERLFGLAMAAIGAVFLLASSSVRCAAVERIALLIANQEYASEIGRLASPHRDVARLEKALTRLGFDVVTVRDASLAALHQAINVHVRRVRSAGAGAVGFFYYAGHGAQDTATGINYLIPVDAPSGQEGELWDRSLRVNEISRRLRLEAEHASHFLVFDACQASLRVKRPDTKAFVQAKGFVPVREESGMLIAFATPEGELVSDGTDAGQYARVLAEEIVKPGVEAVTMFRRVQLRMRTLTGREPWLGFGALAEVHLAGVQSPAATTPAAAYEQQVEEAFWSSVQESDDPNLIETYLKRYPGGTFAELAKARLDRLKRQAGTSVAAVPPGPDHKPASQADVANDPDGGREMALEIQRELKRVQCHSGAVDGQWSKPTEAALGRFAERARIALHTDRPTRRALDAIKAQGSVVCPPEVPPPIQKASPDPVKQVGTSRNCRRESKQECRRRVCPTGSGCGLRGTGICAPGNRKAICG
jgi:uncharacterized caspase-like protein